MSPCFPSSGLRGGVPPPESTESECTRLGRWARPGACPDRAGLTLTRTRCAPAASPVQRLLQFWGLSGGPLMGHVPSAVPARGYPGVAGLRGDGRLLSLTSDQ